jgi:8-oxo-dGTP pyrophosphatase MutT (NUDIX family)
MERRQYTASAYTIDFKNHSVLLTYNSKLKKWLQPGGHILDRELEMPWDAAIRETREETGIDIEIIGPILYGKHQPVAVEHYSNSVGDMIDIQYLAQPLSTDISGFSNVCWQDIFTIDFNSDIDAEIKEKVKELYRINTR